MRKVTYRARLSRVQRLAALGIAGALRTTPTLSLEAALGLTPIHIYVEAEAQKSAVRLNDWGQFKSPRVSVGHGSIWTTIIKSHPILLRRDAIIPAFVLRRKYQVIIPSRERWLHSGLDMLTPQGLLWFTDGSVARDQAGAGICGIRPRVSIKVALGSHISVHQAELIAILICAQENLMKRFKGKHIYICSDSRAALGTLTARRVNSRLALDCMQALDRLASTNVVKLVWVPGHSGVEGNMRADELARQGSTAVMVGPQPSVGLSRSIAKVIIKRWECDKFCMEWQTNGHGQSIKFIDRPLEKVETKRLLNLSRSQLRAILGVLTGHWMVNYHLKNIGLVDSSSCRFCYEDDETTEHLVCFCTALEGIRLVHLGDTTVEPGVIRHIQSGRVLSFLGKLGLTG